MVVKTDPAKAVRQAQDLIKECNRVLLNDANDLPQAFEQSADVLELLAAMDWIVLEGGGDPKAEAATTAAELRAVAAGGGQFAKNLADPASARFLMEGSAERAVLLSPKEIEAARTPADGWKRDQLAA
ncbi:hypothetical protein [Streptomyces sp. NPDC088757]|uniref:hypothetical protein n=1 Tax=Streptomyces sp. NPDC088757 TaxID=3365889 RepID=UPI0037F3AE70